MKKWLRHLWIWPAERRRRREVEARERALRHVEQRVEQAAEAARVAREQWPAVRRAQQGFAADMRSAMYRRYQQ